ncbi:MAG TPA: dienelactone hydrolase family protein [Gammaproteobacteria bacterium]|nr:dienelactone hydrolase family protein [Gammaproteobacteria bacterium]
MSDTTLISIPNTHGCLANSYFAPTQSVTGPGIVLLQEIFGVNNSIRTCADRFAKAGYNVLAPDLFWRLKPGVQLSYGGEDLEQAFDYYHQFDVEQGLLDIGEAIAALRNRPACENKIIVLGFCLGGRLAYLTAAKYPVDACVAFYGGRIADYLQEAKNIRCPVLMHFGEEDEMIPPDQIDRIKAAFNGRRDVQIEVYPQVGHAFFNQDRSSFNIAAADLAYQKTLDFLQHYVKAS